MNIEISPRSQKLIKKYLLISGEELPSIISSIDLSTLIAWLNEEQIKHSKQSKIKQQKIEFILVSLRTELLQNLFDSMKGDDVRPPENDKNNTGLDKIKFVVLTMAGILVAACQGFDGIVTMLSIFNLSASMILGIGLAFSFLSVIVFCGFDLVKVSEALGVKLSHGYKLLDAYLLQLQMLKSMRKKIDNYCLSNLSQDDLKQLEHILSMLQKRFTSLTKASEQFELALNSEGMQMTKTLISGVSALLFLGGGFFAGQSVAFFISALINSSMIPPFWPVIIFSTIVGLAALSIYWYIERPVLNKLVSNWFGLNEESVQKLCERNLIVKEAKKLENLKGKVISAARLNNRVMQSELGVGIHEELVNESFHERVAIATRASTNYYSFLKSPEPLGLLPAISIDKENLDITYCSI